MVISSPAEELDIFITWIPVKQIELNDNERADELDTNLMNPNSMLNHVRLQKSGVNCTYILKD